MISLKTIALTAAFSAALTGCMESPPIPLDDPRWAEADARHEGSLYGASGIAGLAYIGVGSNPDNANIFYDQDYTNAAEISAAPGKICAYLGGTVATSEVIPAGGSFTPSTRALMVTCTI